MTDQRIAVITPSWARDFELCRELNESVLRFFPPDTRHYLIVDRKDLGLFRQLAETRTIVAAVEDVIPRGYFKLPRVKRWWFSTSAMFPAKGWVIQQLVKLSADSIADEPLLVNVDSDVRFIRPVSKTLFFRNGKTRIYCKPGGIVPGMPHVIWHHSICGLLYVEPDLLPMGDYVGNMISWDRRLVAGARERIETVTRRPWHVAYTRSRRVSEYLLYGLYVDKVLGQDAAGVWVDERPWCHTYWGPGPLAASEVARFVEQLPDDDVAFSIGGYTDTDREIVEHATDLVVQRANAIGATP